MAQTPVTLQPASAILPVGTTTFSTTSLGAGYSMVVLTLPRGTWTDSAGVEILEFLIDVSFDSGTTWHPWCGFGVAGGTVQVTNKAGQVVTVAQHVLSHSIPANCQVRGRLLNKTGASLTALSVQAVCT